MGEHVSYAEWGEEFFRIAVTEERILGAVNNLAGKPIDVGPMGAGPGRIAKIRATGAIGQARAERRDGSAIAYHVSLPVQLDFELNLQVETHRFHADLQLPLELTAKALSGARILIEVEPPRAVDIEVDLRAEGLRASLMQRIAKVERELRRFVAKYVARELTKPYVEEARLIDVASMIDRAYASIPAVRKQVDDEVVSDFSQALEEEIRGNESALLNGDVPEDGNGEPEEPSPLGGSTAGAR